MALRFHDSMTPWLQGPHGWQTVGLKTLNWRFMEMIAGRARASNGNGGLLDEIWIGILVGIGIS